MYSSNGSLVWPSTGSLVWLSTGSLHAEVYTNVSKGSLCLVETGTKMVNTLWSKATLEESWPCAEDKVKRDTCAGGTLRGLLPSGSFVS